MNKEKLNWCVVYKYFSLDDKAWHKEIWAKTMFEVDAVAVLRRIAHDFDFEVSIDGTVATRDHMTGGIHTYTVMQTLFAETVA